MTEGTNLTEEEPGDTPIAALQRAAAESPESVFLDFVGETYTYAEFDRLSSRAAWALGNLGVTAGDTVVTLMDSCIDAVVFWFAIAKLGAIWVPVNTAYRHEFLRHHIADASAKVMICGANYLDHVLEVSADTPELQQLIVRGDIAAGIIGRLRIVQLHEESVEASDRPFPEIAPRDIACLFYTSGTTGASKGCIITHNYMCNFARTVLTLYPHHHGDVHWSPLPLFHAGAICSVILPTMLVRATASVYPWFSVSAFWPEMERSGATIVTLIGSMFNFIADAPDSDSMRNCRGQLRCVIGAPVSDDVRRIWFERFAIGYFASFAYGQTEGCRITNLKYGEPLPPLGSAGRQTEDFEVIVADDGDRPVPAGVIGEILYRPRKPHIMFEGYWKRPADTVAAWRNLWMHSGDLGKFDEYGNLYFVDRKKDYIRRRGENISNFEMETAFLQHPDVAEVAYHAVLAASAEDDIKVTIVLAQGSTLSERALCEWAMDRLPYFAVPRFIEFRSELPRNGVGRVVKYKLRADGRTAATWDMHESGLTVRRK
jgi:crotonobetaine/carnitine-CoA ligase